MRSHASPERTHGTGGIDTLRAFSFNAWAAWVVVPPCRSVVENERILSLTSPMKSARETFAISRVCHERKGSVQTLR
jgi:hypothetical protein